MPLYLPPQGSRNSPVKGYCQIGAQNIPRLTKSGVIAGLRASGTLSNLANAGDDAPYPVFYVEDIDLGGAALFRAPQDQFLRPGVALRRREPGLDRARDRSDGAADLYRRPALAGDQHGLRRASRDSPGISVQPDRNVLQPDAAVL